MISIQIQADNLDFLKKDIKKLNELFNPSFPIPEGYELEDGGAQFPALKMKEEEVNSPPKRRGRPPTKKEPLAQEVAPRVVDEMPKPELEPPVLASAPEKPEPKFTLDDAKSALKKLTETHGMDKGIELVQGVLLRFGAKKVSEVDPKAYHDFIEYCLKVNESGQP